MITSSSDANKISAPQSLTFSEIVSRNLKDILVCAGIFAALSVWVIFQINALESGSEESVTVWKPVATIYDLLGYWPAILFVPALAVFCAIGAYGVQKKGGPRPE
jgi:hypothetical protein